MVYEKNAFESISHCKYMGANNPLGGANFDSRGRIGRIYVGHHITLLHTLYIRTDGPVNAHLIWIALFVGELMTLMTPALGCGLYGPQEHIWQDLKRGLLNIATHKI